MQLSQAYAAVCLRKSRVDYTVHVCSTHICASCRAGYCCQEPDVHVHQLICLPAMLIPFS